MKIQVDKYMRIEPAMVELSHPIRRFPRVAARAIMTTSILKEYVELEEWRLAGLKHVGYTKRLMFLVCKN